MLIERASPAPPNETTLAAGIHRDARVPRLSDLGRLASRLPFRGSRSDFGA
jgi:hypothetical protein